VTAGIATSVSALDSALDEAAAKLFARCPAIGSLEEARAMITTARASEREFLSGLIHEGNLAAVYLLRQVSMSNEIALLAVAAGQERQGFGKMCLYDALFRSGKRPIVALADETNLGFFKQCGFKLVGKRRGPDGSTRYRLGWHAPIPKPDNPGETIC
jgi:ribosomal protein S18 acetylase RimI-like enzyme